MSWVLVLILVTPAGTAMHTAMTGITEASCRNLAKQYERQMSEYSQHAGARALCLNMR